MPIDDDIKREFDHLNTRFNDLVGTIESIKESVNGTREKHEERIQTLEREVGVMAEAFKAVQRDNEKQTGDIEGLRLRTDQRMTGIDKKMYELNEEHDQKDIEAHKAQDKEIEDLKRRAVRWELIISAVGVVATIAATHTVTTWLSGVK